MWQRLSHCQLQDLEDAAAAVAAACRTARNALLEREAAAADHRRVMLDEEIRAAKAKVKRKLSEARNQLQAEQQRCNELRDRNRCSVWSLVTKHRDSLNLSRKWTGDSSLPAGQAAVLQRTARVKTQHCSHQGTWNLQGSPSACSWHAVLLINVSTCIRHCF